MDLQDFAGDGLYFDDPQEAQVSALLERAAQGYADGTAEADLLQALALAPENLSVLVGLYRFHYYQHRPADAVQVAERIMAILAERLGLPADWRELDMPRIQQCEALGLLRLHLLALKGAGYLNLRRGLFGQGKQMLAKVCQLDPLDRLGAGLLMRILAGHDAHIIPFPNGKAEQRA